MIPDSRYLIDANVFIQAKNFHYRFEFCQAFWQWLTDGHEAGFIFSTAKVLEELNDGTEPNKRKPGFTTRISTRPCTLTPMPTGRPWKS